MAKLERLRFELLGRGHWTASYKGHVYEVEGHPDRGYVIFRDGERRYPYAINTLRMAQQIADDIAEFDKAKSKKRRTKKKTTKRKKNPVLTWLPAERKRRWKHLTDAQLREEIAELHEEIRYNKAALKKVGKRPTLQQMVAHGDPHELRADIDDIKREIQSVKDVIEARKDERRKKREAKKPPRPPKAPVMRRRAGTTTRANPVSINQIMRDAMK